MNTTRRLAASAQRIILIIARKIGAVKRVGLNDLAPFETHSFDFDGVRDKIL